MGGTLLTEFAAPTVSISVEDLPAAAASGSSGSTANPASGRRGFCHVCECEVRATLGSDSEFYCPRCHSSCVELLHEEVVVRAGYPQLADIPPLVSEPGLPASHRPPPPRPPRVRHREVASANRIRPRLRDEQAFAQAQASQRHFGVTCDGCQVRDFTGTRYRCLSCLDYDLCEACHGRREVIHPEHQFEVIRTPRSIFQSLLNSVNVNTTDPADAASRFGRTVITVVEFSMDADEDAQSGLDDQQVAWWLADEGRLADISSVSAQDPPWTCAICSEGLEAENSNGWVVRTCNDPCEKVGSEGGTGETEGHIYHESCLRKWLIRKNACPVCRRSPIVPDIR